MTEPQPGGQRAIDAPIDGLAKPISAYRAERDLRLPLQAWNRLLIAGWHPDHIAALCTDWADVPAGGMHYLADNAHALKEWGANPEQARRWLRLAWAIDPDNAVHGLARTRALLAAFADQDTDDAIVVITTYIHACTGDHDLAAAALGAGLRAAEASRLTSGSTAELWVAASLRGSAIELPEDLRPADRDGGPA